MVQLGLRALALFAVFAGFIGGGLSLVLNVATYVATKIGTIPLTMDHWWFLHVSCMLVAVVGAISGNKLAQSALPPNQRRRNGRLPIPPPSGAVATFLGIGLALTIANFVAFIALMILSGGGQPRMYEGRFALMDHSRLIRYVDEEEYNHRQSIVLRGFSGHWALFHMAGATYALAGLRAASKAPRPS